LHSSAIKLQTDYIFKNTGIILEAAGTNFDNVLSINQFVTDWGYLDGYIEARDKFMKPPRPASTAVDINQILTNDAVIEIDIMALISEGNLQREIVSTDKIPRPIAGYSQATKAGNFIFTSGDLATDFVNPIAPEARVNTNYWVGSEIKRQTEYTLQKLEAVLKEAGSSLNKVVKANVYLTDIGDMYKMDEVWRKYFPIDPPARTIIPVKKLAWLGCRIEITLIAVTQNTDKEVVRVDRMPAPLTHESYAIKAGGLLFVSGQMAVDENGLAGETRSAPLCSYYENPVKKQTEYIMKNLEYICRAAGLEFKNVVSVHSGYLDLKDFGPSYEVLTKYFGNDLPTNTTIRVPEPFQVPGCNVVIDMIGYVP
jgi:reactive intermediate/imine deaminase